MAYEVKIITDSIAPSDVRLTTLQVTLPRIVLAELNTHRMFSRNSASSRAIPVEKMITRVKDDPFIPVYWGKNQKGMQADQELTQAEQELATNFWLAARDNAIDGARYLLQMGVHKQIANRLLEPWLWHTVIITATQWSNFFAQRCHPDAQPEIRKAAEMMQAALESSIPSRVEVSAWHLPYVSNEERSQFDDCQLRCLSVARCARVSYLSQEGKRDTTADFALFDRLKVGMHWSPFEHVARALANRRERSGNFTGWWQFRKGFSDECR